MTAPSIVFRVDASLEIGTGHVMRCLTLADTLSIEGAICTFICRDLDGHLGDTVRKAGHKLHLLQRPERWVDDGKTAHSAWLGVAGISDADESRSVISRLSPDWLVIDHYALEATWHESLGIGVPTLVIDDLADRRHRCDILVDQNLGRSPADYAAWVGPQTKVLTGPDYALLRPEFARFRSSSLQQRGDVINRVLVAPGGVDKSNVTLALLKELTGHGFDIDIVLGPTAPHLAEVSEYAPFVAANLHVGTTEMAKLMSAADLAIGGAGTTTWERCALGLPSIVLVMAENQRAGAAALVASGAAKLIDGPAQLRQTLGSIAAKGTLMRMSRCAAKITDGNGVKRVVSAIMNSAHR